MKYLLMAAIGLYSLSFISCQKDDGPSQAAKDDELIRNYLAEHNLEAQATGSGLYVLIQDEGSGTNPTLYDEVTVHYKGYLTNGDVFDLTGSEPATFPLSQVIQGWQEGIPYLKPGGAGILFVPSALGYGENSVGSIPPNSVLIFEVELIRVN
jgi:FKBP-type peptidyl-prolyl cis-trans isomerase FkpA